jgi:hypothetical protein
MTNPLVAALRAAYEFTLFRDIGGTARRHGGALLAVGLVLTWLAGIGRYWDSPNAGWWQYAGLGSLAYAFVLAALLWGVVTPVAPQRRSYSSWLTFVSLTATPALLYGIPVERFMSPDGARLANIWFLGVVALWRVALLARHLGDACGLGFWGVLVSTLFPINLVIVALAMLNLENATFEVMAGLESAPPTAADERYSVVVVLTLFSTFTLPLLAISYAVLAVEAAQARRRTASVGGEES